ncbi:hypothetical protein CCMA1212_004136 [Trichoderma ghanense]|uniref:Uncharacterized protein n=1 Tax=Trichoderma ghanense TaxID=65468 RepID=A0ABY2HB68_9HYPO
MTTMEIINSFEVIKKVDGNFRIYIKVIAKQEDNYYIGKWRDRKQLPNHFSQLEDVKIIPTKTRRPAMNSRWTTGPPTGDFYAKEPAFQDYVDPELEERIEHEI